MIPRWATVAPGVSLEGFKAFVKTQSGRYRYLNSRECPFALYLKSLGYSAVMVFGHTYTVDAEFDQYDMFKSGYTEYDMDHLHPNLSDSLPNYTVMGQTFEALSTRLEDLK